MKQLLTLLALAGCLTACATPDTSTPTPARATATATNGLGTTLNGQTWSGSGQFSKGAPYVVEARFNRTGARVDYKHRNCTAIWTLASQSENKVTYAERITAGACSTNTIIVYKRSKTLSVYAVDGTKGPIMATVLLSPGQSATATRIPAAATARVTTPPRDCGSRPKRPRIPSRPAGLSCSSSAIKTRLNNCTVAGVAEVACGEALEGRDTRISTGAVNGALCSAGSAIAQGRSPNKGDAIGSAIIGAVDNAGESVGGIFGGLIRLTAAGVKMSVVNDCKRDVRVQCDPERALRPYRARLATYNACRAGQ